MLLIEIGFSACDCSRASFDREHGRPEDPPIVARDSCPPAAIPR
jgi:hypothetical protein